VPETATWSPSPTGRADVQADQLQGSLRGEVPKSTLYTIDTGPGSDRPYTRSFPELRADVAGRDHRRHARGVGLKKV
jgi:hypothetical protein